MTSTANAAALDKPKLIGTWVAQILVLAIFAMGAPWSKLMGAEGPKAIFDAVGLGAPGMYATGVAELAAMVLIVIPATAWAGAGLAALVMLGAISSHLFLGLGVSISSDLHPDVPAGPMMFAMAVIALLASLAVLYIRRAQIPGMGAKLAGGGSSQSQPSSAS